MKKILLSFIFAFFIFTGFNACAEEFGGSFSEIYRSPFAVTQQDSKQDLFFSQGSDDSAPYTDCNDIENAALFFKKSVLNRESTVKIKYSIPGTYDYTEASSVAKASVNTLKSSLKTYSDKDDNAALCDYALYNSAGYAINYSYYIYPKFIEMNLTVNFSWYTTKEQEELVNRKVDEILTGLDVFDKSDYEKVYAVYEYILNNAEYVDSAKYNKAAESNEHLIYHTAYSALIMGETVCQGYATALYRLLRELGISTRVIAGYAGGENHAWNIVRVGSFYYLADATWDDANPSLHYFLKAKYYDHNTNDKVFNTDYSTPEFQRMFPMADEDYSTPLEYYPNPLFDGTIEKSENGTTISFFSDYTVHNAAIYGVNKDGEKFLANAYGDFSDKKQHKAVISDDIYDFYKIVPQRIEYNSYSKTATVYESDSPMYLGIFTVTFINYNGEVLSCQTVNYGESAVYTGTLPERPADNMKIYSFKGWDKDTSHVTENLTVTAQFNEEVLPVQEISSSVDKGVYTANLKINLDDKDGFLAVLVKNKFNRVVSVKFIPIEDTMNIAVENVPENFTVKYICVKSLASMKPMFNFN